MWSSHTEVHGIAAGMPEIQGPEDLVQFRTKLREQMGLPLMWAVRVRSSCT